MLSRWAVIGTSLDGIGPAGESVDRRVRAGHKRLGPCSQALLWVVDVAVFLWIVHGARHMRGHSGSESTQSFMVWIGGVP